MGLDIYTAHSSPTFHSNKSSVLFCIAGVQLSAETAAHQQGLSQQSVDEALGRVPLSQAA